MDIFPGCGMESYSYTFCFSLFMIYCATLQNHFWNEMGNRKKGEEKTMGGGQ